MEYSVIFNAFINEAQFTKEILGIGATLIRKANYASKGMYYEAFICLSTGLERIGKLCLILDYYIDHDGKLPDSNYIRNNIGHNLIKLYNESCNIIKKHQILFEFSKTLDSKIYQDIISILSNFAKGDRYSNINVLSNTIQQTDSMQLWYDKIDKYIYNNKISYRKKEKIIKNAEIIKSIIGDFSCINYISENGEKILDIEEASFRTGMQEAVAPYRQLFVLQIIRYWVEVLDELGYIALKMRNTDIPYFSEIFAIFYNSDTYFRSRKTWDKI